MKLFKPYFIVLMSVAGLIVTPQGTVLADENPFTEEATAPSSQNSRPFMQGMCGTGRCGRCGRCGGCGGGMMWGGRGKPKIGDITELPEPQSEGAKLVNRYCTQCHALPNPRLHSAEGWLPTIERMNARMQWMSKNGNDIIAPSESEIETLMAYVRKHSL